VDRFSRLRLDGRGAATRHLPSAALATLAVIAAGCGSSHKSTSSAASAPAASPAAQTTQSATGAGSATTLTTKHNKLGTIIAAARKRRAVYLLEADKGSASGCTGACASVWQPVTSAGAPAAKGSASGAEVGVTGRADGTREVTYHGRPLYFFARDSDPSDAYGQGLKSFGAGWYVLAPSAKKIDAS
jgi:predicted lipoprotein with Yx(FWY)xxD motif